MVQLALLGQKHFADTRAVTGGAGGPIAGCSLGRVFRLGFEKTLSSARGVSALWASFWKVRR